MSDGKKLMQTLEKGELARTDEKVFLQFMGREWHVYAYVGTRDTGGVALFGPHLEKDVELRAVVDKILKAAIGAGYAGGLSLNELAEMFAQAASVVVPGLQALQANKGKPS